MGKAGRRRPRRATIAVDGDEFEDGMSVASFDTYETHSSGVEAGAQEGFCSKSETGSVIGGTMDHGSEAQDEFRDAVDQLIEGRASARESGLRKVMHFMLHSTDLELVVSMQSTIMRSLISLLRRKGTEGESVQALKALSVLCVCMGPEEEEAYRSMKRPLRMLITRSRHSGIRVAAVHTLALACFICSSDDDDTQEALELLSKVLSRTSEGLEVPDKLVAAALSGWGLLATTVSRVWVATRMTAEHLKNLRDLLGSKDLDIRMEAGENLALLHESRLLMGLMEGAAEESEDIGEADLPLDWEGEEQGRGTQYTEDGAELGNDAGVAKGDELEGGVAEEGSGDDSGDGDGVREDEEEEEKEEEDDDDDDEEEEVMDLMLLWEEVVEEMKGFVTESSKKLSRETKKQQRRTFRQLLATIGDNEPPEEVVSLQNGSLTVTDWAHIKQLNALRSCLQSGFQAHMESNELLREILGVSSWGGTGDEKHVYSKNSQVRKRQTTTRTRSRNRKILEQEGILGGGACGGW